MILPFFEVCPYIVGRLVLEQGRKYLKFQTGTFPTHEKNMFDKTMFSSN